MKYLKEKADEFGIDGEKIVLAGAATGKLKQNEQLTSTA